MQGASGSCLGIANKGAPRRRREEEGGRRKGEGGRRKEEESEQRSVKSESFLRR